MRFVIEAAVLLQLIHEQIREWTPQQGNPRTPDEVLPGFRLRTHKRDPLRWPASDTAKVAQSHVYTSS